MGLFILGSVLAVSLARWLNHRLQTQTEAQYQRWAERTSHEIVRRLTQPLYGINGARGLYAASEEVTRSEFADDVFSRDLLNEFPGMSGFGFIERARPFQSRSRQDDAGSAALWLGATGV